MEVAAATAESPPKATGIYPRHELMRLSPRLERAAAASDDVQRAPTPEEQCDIVHFDQLRRRSTITESQGRGITLAGTQSDPTQLER